MLLSSFPEELLELVLAEAVVTSPTPSSRPSWHSPLDLRTRVAPVLVSTKFQRICVPLFYHTVVLHSTKQSQAFLATLHAQPAFARCVRRLVLLAPSDADVEILRILRDAGARVQYLDVTLPCEDRDSGLADALRSLEHLQDLVVRKGPATYLSQLGPRAVLEALATLITSCANLESATLSFPLSADPALASLVAALTVAPALTTLRTPLPSFWTPTLLSVSVNPSLRRICLGDDLSALPKGNRRPIMATSLFLSVARQHPRLSDLIRAGTTVLGWRVRAFTMGSVDLGPHPPSVNAPEARECACS